MPRFSSQQSHHTHRYRAADALAEVSPLHRILALIGCVVCLGLFAELYLTFVHSAHGQHLDVELRKQLIAFRYHPTLVRLLHSLMALWVVAMAALTVVSWRKIGFDLTIGLLVACLAILFSAEYLKHVLVRVQIPHEPSFNTFPSGHVAGFGGLCVMALMLVRAGWRRWALVGVALLGMVAVSLAVVGYQWHQPSDAVGSILLTGAVGGALEATLRRPVVHRLHRVVW